MALSLAELDATKASAEAHEFEYITPAGDETGLFFSVLGGQSEVVTAASYGMVNERRRKEAVREVNARISVGRKKVEIDLCEDDVAQGQRIAATRLVGWRGPNDRDGLTPEQLERFQGIIEPFTPENALKLCRGNREIAAAITLQSDEMANFIAI